jgi:hypothetical protein
LPLEDLVPLCTGFTVITDWAIAMYWLALISLLPAVTRLLRLRYDRSKMLRRTTPLKLELNKIERPEGMGNGEHS